MARCEYCRTKLEGVTHFVCNYCESSHCPDHRLPEKHECVAPLVPQRVQKSVATDIDTDRAAESQQENTPCEECGRPCPTDDTYCSPCQKDIRDRSRRPATSEEIRDHRRRYDPNHDPPSPPSRLERVLEMLPRIRTVIVLALLSAGALWYLGYGDIVLDGIDLLRSRVFD